MRPRSIPTCWGLAIAAGLIALLPATAARAQYSMGFDSFVYEPPPPQTFWAGAGFPSMYTDPSTGVFADGEYVGNRTVAPYTAPPYGLFPQRGGLPAVYPRPAVAAAQPHTAEAAAAPAPQTIVRPRRVLIKRKR